MLDKILKYQEIDAELVANENELNKSADKEKATQLSQVLKNQHAKLMSCDAQAEKVNAAYKKATEKYAEFMKKLETLEKEMNNADESKVAVYEKAYKDFAAIANSLEKDIANIYQQVQQLNKDYEFVIKKSKEDRVKFDKHKAAYNKLKTEKEPKIAELAKKLETLGKSVDAKLLAVYKQKREGHLFPVIVELAASKCSGCRMEVSASKIAQMKNNNFGLIECENCGRLIYKK